MDTSIYKNYKEISGKLWKMYDIEKDEYKKKHTYTTYNTLCKHNVARNLPLWVAPSI